MEAHNSNNDFTVGCILSIKTPLGEEFQGQVLTSDRSSNILVLKEGINSGSRPNRNIRLLKANYIKEFTFLGHGKLSWRLKDLGLLLQLKLRAFFMLCPKRTRPSWVGLEAAAWLQIASGNASTFPLYSHSLKSVLGFNQHAWGG
ncbi:uncharacterized protein LOC113748825 [Coffea eugenioides]|uniref:uncharacterized protein LOC113748825 n=1 Tax=Coffea eugenioides TaxID=49369 RepID=UPI000F6149F2|nr:uncharacterized protein LOC113748825 [Coffea eugenioides]